MLFRTGLKPSFWVEQATGLFRRATSPPGCSAASCRRERAGSPFHPFLRQALPVSLLLALALCGCTTKSKALAQSRGAFIAGQQQGFAQSQAQAQTSSTDVTFLGDVRNRTVEWVEELTLTQAIVAAEYLHPRDPTSITITRQGRKYEVSPKRLLKGLEDPYLEPGDLVELHR